MLGPPTDSAFDRFGPRPAQSSTRSALEAVTEPADGDEHDRVAGVLLDARADALDVNIQRLGVAEVVATPHAVDQLAAGEHPACIAHQQLEQLELLERHVDLAAVDRDRVPVDVQARSEE